jgi:hypothetical protein
MALARNTKAQCEAKAQCEGAGQAIAGKPLNETLTP